MAGASKTSALRRQHPFLYTVNDTLASEGAELPTMTLQPFGAYLRSEITKYADLSKLSLRLE
jgi:hypothetical protein